jgi:hypothetical protein
MDRTHQRLGIAQPNAASDDIVYCSPCSGFAISGSTLEWSQFALGQLVALAIATLFLSLLVLSLSLFSVFG